MYQGALEYEEKGATAQKVLAQCTKLAASNFPKARENHLGKGTRKLMEDDWLEIVLKMRRWRTPRE